MESLPPVELTLPRGAPSAVVQRVEAQPGFELRPLADWLQALPGLQATERGNFAQDAQLSLRGFGARSAFGVRGLRILVDGVPQTPPDGAGSSVGLPLSLVRHVDLVRGPFSALYGSNSGGVLALATALRAESAATLRAAADGERGAQLRTGGEAWTLAAERWRIDGWRAQQRAARDQFDARAELGAWKFAANWHDQQAQDPQGVTPAQFQAGQTTAPQPLAFNTRKRTRAGQLSLSWAEDGRQLAAWWGQRRVGQWQAIPVATQGPAAHPGGVIALERTHAGLDVRQRWQGGAAGAAWRFDLGLQAELQQDERQGFENFIGAQTGLTGRLRRDERNGADAVELYAQAQRALDAQTQLHAGLRMGSLRLRSRDHYLVNGDDSGARRLVTGSPAVGLSHRSGGWQWFANAGAAQETPTLNEMAYRADGSAGFNGSLNPQRSVQLEAGVRGEWLQLSLFTARSRDEIVVASSSGGRTSFRNAARTRRQGVELGAQQRFGAWRAEAALTTLSARLDDGQRLPGAAAQRGRVSLQWEAGPWSAHLIAQGQSRLAAGPGQTVPGFGLLHAQAHGQLPGAPGWRWGLGVDNLLDRRHAASVIVGEASGRFVEPGAPRRVWISLALQGF